MLVQFDAASMAAQRWGRLLALTVVATSAPVLAQAEDYKPLTKKRLQAAYSEALEVCEKSYGRPLDPAVPLDITTKTALAKTIAAENLPIILLREPDPATAQAQSNLLGRQLAVAAVAKYSWKDRKVMVVTESWGRIARNSVRPLLLSDVGLRAIFVHELCHAYDDQRFDFAKLLQGSTTANATTALNAVFEGSAQLRSRRICAKAGWSEGFEALREVVSLVPKSFLENGEAAALVARANAAVMSFAYHDGERFAAAVVAADPENGLERIFTQPPKDQESVLRPEWYLDPSKRPALLYEPEPALDLIVKRFDPEIWTATRVDVTGQQIAAGLGLLPKDEVEAFAASVRRARMVQLVPTAAPQSKMVVMIVMEVDSPETATRWIDMSKRLSSAKDEAMKTGLIRILDAKTTAIADVDAPGWLQEKTMMVGKSKVGVASIDIARGRLVVETIFSGENLAPEEHCRLAKDCLMAVRLIGDKAEPTEAGTGKAPR